VSRVRRALRRAGSRQWKRVCFRAVTRPRKPAAKPTATKKPAARQAAAKKPPARKPPAQLADKRRARASHQLPAGRHGLPRSFVVHNQRERILSAVASVAGVAGYPAMTVEDIIAEAGLSRRTFYDHFKSKEDAFLAAYDAGAAQLIAIVAEAFAASDDFVQQAVGGLQALLETLANEPGFAAMCIVEVLAAGPAAVERRNAAMAAFAALIQQSAETLPKSRRPPPLTAETVVGGIYEVIYARVLRGESAELPGLVPDLTYSMLLPFAGQEVALETFRAAKRRRSRRKPG
jgi:AcrR family transcriptional regulator